MPALAGEASFDYTSNDGKYVIGNGERTFTLNFGARGHGSIYVLSDPPDIKSVALGPGVTSRSDLGEPWSYDGSSRYRTINVGDAAVIQNRHNYWAAVFVDEVLIRETSPTRNPSITFRFCVPSALEPQQPA